MESKIDPTSTILALGDRQDGVVHYRQLRAIGLTDRSIRHRISTGVLHPRWPGVYAVGRCELSRRGEWRAAVLTCGPGAVLSHLSAANLWGFWRTLPTEIEVSIPWRRRCRRQGLTVHRTSRLETTIHRSLPVTPPARTLVDLAAHMDREHLEEVTNEAIRLGRTTERQLGAAIHAYANQPGVVALRSLLRGFTLTQSRLERLFLPIAKRAGLPRPLTQQWVNGFRVDFYWPGLKLVVETDGGAFHRTASRQTDDRRRDQAHYAAGLTPLRFTHDQVAHDQSHVQRVLELGAE